VEARPDTPDPVVARQNAPDPSPAMTKAAPVAISHGRSAGPFVGATVRPFKRAAPSIWPSERGCYTPDEDADTAIKLAGGGAGVEERRVGTRSCLFLRPRLTCWDPAISEVQQVDLARTRRRASAEMLERRRAVAVDPARNAETSERIWPERVTERRNGFFLF
jgi:hypothetical protein